MVPLSTFRNRIQGMSGGKLKRVGSISVKVRDGQSMKAAEDNIRELLRQRHRLQPQQDDDFSVRNLTEMLAAQEESSRVMTLLLAAVAGVSLLVGGIGIMNIMLVSVTERTREIGLRMAVGARGRDILTQFLVEAVTLSLIGGAIGVVLGAAATFSVAQRRRLAGGAERAQSVALAVGLFGRGGRVLRLLPGAPRRLACCRSRLCATSERRGAPLSFAAISTGRTIGYRHHHDAGQGRHHGHRGGPHRVPADLEHRPPDPGRLAARPHRRQEQGVRHCDPDRCHLRRDDRLRAAPCATRVAGLGSDRRAQRFTLNVAIGFLPAVVLGLLFGKAIKEHLFTPVVVASTFIIGGFIILWAERRSASQRCASTRSTT